MDYGHEYPWCDWDDADFMLKRDFWMQILWSQGIFLSILIQFLNYAKWNS